MARITQKSRTGFIWIPRPFDYQYKIQIVRDSTTDVITSDVLNVKWNKPVTKEVGEFSCEIDNNGEEYTDLYTGNETFQIFIDWAGASPTTKVFEGVIERIAKKFDDKRGNSIVFKGTHVGSELLNVSVTASYSAQTAHSIVSDLIGDYASGFTTTNVETSGDAATTMTVKWNAVPLWTAIGDVCDISGCDCYVDDDKDVHFFESGSHECTLDACVWQDNLLKVEGLSTDTLEIVNKVVVNGEDDENVPVIAVAEDSDSQSTYGVREKVISDSDIDSYTDALARANAELELANELEGSASCEGMTFVSPGDLIYISDPLHGIHGQYKAYNILNELDFGYFTTEIEVRRPKRGVPQVFKNNIEKDLQEETINNPNRLEFSYNFTFDTALDSDSLTDSYSNVSVSGGALVLDVGESSGTWESAARSTGSEVTEVELRLVGQDYDASTIKVSANNGINWSIVDKNTVYSSSGGDFVSGSNLKVKLESLVSDSDNPKPKVESLAVLYK